MSDREAVRAGALALAGVAASFWGLAAPVDAQPAGTAALDSVAAAADSGRIAWARRTLDRWMEDDLAGAPPEVQARARLLQGRLAEDPEEARRAYALVAVDGGQEGARARLRLAQFHLARDRYERALEELATVRADAPGSTLETRAWLWAGRVREAEGEASVACEAYRRASETPEPADDQLREAVTRAAEACRRGDGAPAWETELVADGAADRAGPDDGRYAVQLGAFSRGASARALRQRVAGAGFDVRLVGPDPEDGLLRVRAGAFDREAEARDLARRVEEAGFRAIVVEVGSRGDAP